MIAARKKAPESVLLAAITELVELRLLARRGEYPEVGPNIEQCEGGLGRALRIRAQLAQALQSEPGSEEERIEELRRLALRLETLPDVNGLGHVHNCLAVTLRRAGELDLAARSLRYAAALLVATFDLPTLQAALFNLGHTLHEAAESDGELEEALRVVELDREIYGSLGLGGDSAQAEIVAGLICLKLGRIGNAEAWLAAGQRITRSLGSDYNRAGILLLEARILWAKSLLHSEPAQDRRAISAAYDEVELLVQSVGFTGRDVRDEAATFRRGGRPSWLPTW